MGRQEGWEGGQASVIDGPVAGPSAPAWERSGGGGGGISEFKLAVKQGAWSLSITEHYATKNTEFWCWGRQSWEQLKHFLLFKQLKLSSL